MSVDEILTSLSHLTSSQVHSALAYYFDHQEEIDRDLEKSSEKEYWQQLSKVNSIMIYSVIYKKIQRYNSLLILVLLINQLNHYLR